jgi:prolyl oligopeptidase
MSRRVRALSGALAAVLGVSAAAENLTLTYPATRRGDLVEVQFGEAVADPYRWLENDVRSDPEVAEWVARQNELTAGYLATLPARGWFSRRVRELMDHERFGMPQKAGSHYFYTRNAGLQNQAQLFVRRGMGGEPRLLLDPNTWTPDGAIALDSWKPSEKGRYLLYSVQDSGSDWRVLKLLNARTGKPLPDEIHWVKFTALAWVGEEGFLYSRFPAPRDGQTFRERNYNQAVYFHRIGTPQAADQLVFATPDHPERSHTAQITSDGRYALITSARGTDARLEVHAIDLRARKARGWKAQPLIIGFEHDWKLVEGMGSKLWFVTNSQAPRYRLVSIDLASPAPAWRELIPQAEETLQQGSIVGNKLILSYLKDAASRAVVYDLSGKPAQAITLNGIGTATGFGGRPGDPETFYAFTSFVQPARVYRYNLATGEITPFAKPKLGFDPGAYAVEQRYYKSKDGTRVPMFVVRKKSLAGKAVPTLLYGYGGFDNVQSPGYSAARMAWLEAGGAFALANVRGGGEFGKAWHEAGRLANKQNVFDDFVAAGEYLIAEGIAPKGGLAIQGRSNGGLLVGAVLNQRPDLFAAANPAVGVMDMLRFDRFTIGRFWVDDYGSPGKEADWKVLRSYSPYHNIRKGAAYPAVLVTTADTDDRVVPAHSFKYAAALQAAGGGPRPRLIRIDARAGHGPGKPTNKQVAESADILAFFARWTGLIPS